jgi:hypothetical protein
MATDIVGSHEKPYASKGKSGFGVNGDPSASSLLPGQSKSPIAGVGPSTVTAPGLLHADTLQARVTMDADGKAVAYKSHDGMSNRSTHVETVPASTNRPSKR